MLVGENAVDRWKAGLGEILPAAQDDVLEEEVDGNELQDHLNSNPKTIRAR